MNIPSPQERLFYALWPDPAVSGALVRLQAGLRGSATRQEKLHMTLAFLGQRPASDLPELRAILESVPASACSLTLDTCGYFSGKRIAWAGMRETPQQLLDLRAALVERLAARDLIPVFEHDRFSPHVTLARKAEARDIEAAAALAQEAPIQWRASRLVLAASSQQGYLVVASRLLA
jgi:2'-5' RNA ligase